MDIEDALKFDRGIVQGYQLYSCLRALHPPP